MSRLGLRTTFIAAAIADITVIAIMLDAGRPIYSSLIDGATRIDLSWILVTAMSGMVGLGVIWLLLRVLTETERFGLRIIGRVHRWRITPGITATVCDHASYGWIVAAVLFMLSGFALLIPYRAWVELTGDRGDHRILLVPAALMLGLLVFETLVYIGVRRCKFANRAKPPEAKLPDVKPPHVTGGGINAYNAEPAPAGPAA